LVPMVVLAGFLISMIAIMPMAIADRDDDDDDDDDDDRKDKKKQIDNQVTFIKRTFPETLDYGELLNKSYFCEEDEIIVGGLLKSADPKSPKVFDGGVVDHKTQKFSVNMISSNPERTTINVICLCAT